MNIQTKDHTPDPKIIKVLLVDDSPVALTMIKKMLSAAPDIRVVGTARNGEEALALMPVLDPTVVCTDFHMPVMDGLKLTEEVMCKYPRPILIITVSAKPSNIFKLLESGAVDIFPKPSGELAIEDLGLVNELTSRIRILAGVHVFRRFKESPVAPPKPSESKTRTDVQSSSFKIVAIGASTGGPQALQNILSQIPNNFPLPIICIQHIGEGFLEGLIEWLRYTCSLNIDIAIHGELPLPGTVYFPHENAHLLIDDRGRFVYSSELPLNGHRPSITITFKSVAGYYGNCAIGVLLTGMGNDGDEGMKSIAMAGGFTIAQDEKTSVVFSMPHHAIKLGAAQYVLPVHEIAAILVGKVFANNKKVSI